MRLKRAANCFEECPLLSLKTLGQVNHPDAGEIRISSININLRHLTTKNTKILIWFFFVNFLPSWPVISLMD